MIFIFFLYSIGISPSSTSPSACSVFTHSPLPYPFTLSTPLLSSYFSSLSPQLTAPTSFSSPPSSPHVFFIHPSPPLILPSLPFYFLFSFLLFVPFLLPLSTLFSHPLSLHISFLNKLWLFHKVVLIFLLIMVSLFPLVCRVWLLSYLYEYS